jgi:hypothetical protein
MLRLTIYHNVHLTKDQVYDLHDGKEIVAVGVSMPIWFVGKLTSEPANEVFCKYYLKNPKQEKPIKILEDGYEITIPHHLGESPDIHEAMENLTKLEKINAKTKKEVSSKNLIDIADGGSEFLNYRELDKVIVNNKELSIMHYVVINRMQKLEESLC